MPRRTRAATGRGTSAWSARASRHDPGASEQGGPRHRPRHGGHARPTGELERTDEWYEFRSDPRGRVHVLARARRVASAGLVPPLRWRPLGVHRDGTYQGVLRRAALRPAPARSDRDGRRPREVRLCAVGLLARACILSRAHARRMRRRGRAADARPPPAAETSAPAPPATTAAPHPPTDRDRHGSSPAINSVTVDPGDGTIMIGSGPALFRVEPGAKEAEPLTGTADGGAGPGHRLRQPRRALRRPRRTARLGPPAGGQPAREPRR